MDPFLGEIRMTGFNFAPVGWALCNGQTLAISQYSALFALLGTTYGGDGTSTFNLPNLQGRVPIHWDNGVGVSPYVMGESGGAENVTLLSNQMPIHNHLVNVNNQPGPNQDPPTEFWPKLTTVPGLRFSPIPTPRRRRREHWRRTRFLRLAAMCRIRIFSRS